MAIQTSFTIKHVNVDQALKQAQNKAKQSANKIDKTLNQSASKGLKDAAKGLNAIGQDLGGLTKGFGLFTSKIAIVGAAIGGLAKQIKALWDDLTLSQQEKNLIAQYNLADKRQKRQKTEKQQKIDNGYLQQLKNIASQEEISNRQMLISMQIIENLTQKYGDLGIQVDLATNKIKGLTSAEKYMQKFQKQKRLNDMQSEIKDMKSISWQKMTSLFVGMERGFFARNLMQYIYEDFGKVRPSVNDALNMMNQKSLSQQIDFLTVLRNKSTRTQQIKDLQQLIVYLKQIKILEQGIEKLKKQTGATDDDQSVQNLKKILTSTQSQKSVAESKQQQKKLTEQKAKLQDSYEYKNANPLQKQAMLEKKINSYQQHKLSLEKQSKRIEASYIGYEQEKERKLKPLVEELIKLQSAEASDNNLKRIQQLQLMILDIKTDSQQIALKKSHVAQLNTEILKTEKQIMVYQQQKKEIQMQTDKFYQQRIDNYENDLQYQKLLLKGQYEQAEKLRIINELKKQGLKIDNDKVDKIMDGKEALTDLAINEQLSKQAKQIYDKVAPNKTKQQRIEQRIKQIEKANKQQLSEDQKSKVQKLVSAEINLEKLQGLRLDDFSRFDVQTNELTARGGFSYSPAVLSNSERINMEIKNKSEQQVNLLKQIKQLISDVGVIN